MIKLMCLIPPIEKLDSALNTLVNVKYPRHGPNQGPLDVQVKHLSLSTNCIDKMIPLPGLKNLQILSLGRNQIKKIMCLEEVTNIITIILGQKISQNFEKFQKTFLKKSIKFAETIDPIDIDATIRWRSGEIQRLSVEVFPHSSLELQKIVFCQVGATLQQLWISYNQISSLVRVDLKIPFYHFFRNFDDRFQDGLTPCVKLHTLYISNNAIASWDEIS